MFYMCRFLQQTLTALFCSTERSYDYVNVYKSGLKLATEGIEHLKIAPLYNHEMI